MIKLTQEIAELKNIDNVFIKIDVKGSDSILYNEDDEELTIIIKYKSNLNVKDIINDIKNYDPNIKKLN